jgi:radical SAM superfamily enzyme YgiQ (UPF0313 family)
VIRDIQLPPVPRTEIDVLLVMCPPWDILKPPIGLASLAAYMESKGYPTVAWDLNIKLFNLLGDTPIGDVWDLRSGKAFATPDMTDRFFKQVPGLFEQIIDRILETSAKYIGFSIHSNNFMMAETLTPMIKLRDPSRKVIFGGPQTAWLYHIDELKMMSADAHVMGEGELTLFDAVRHHEAKGEFKPGPGLIVSAGKGEGISEFVLRKPVNKLDLLPYPTYRDIELTDYHAPDGKPILPFMFSRGCTGKCTFCNDHIIGTRFRSRSAENAVAEIEQHLTELGVRHFGFNDLVCNGNLKALETFCDLLIEKDLGIEWWSNAVVRKGMSIELYRKMRASGCIGIIFGLESGSDKMLKLMNKYYTSDVAEENIRNCHNAGIETMVNIIVGFPGETEKEFRETVDFIRRNAEYLDRVANLNPLQIPPGTEIDNFAKRFGIIRDRDADTWTTADGNNFALRTSRVETVRRLLQECDITLVAVNKEPMVGGDKPEVETGTRGEVAAITQVTFRDASGEATTDFATEDELRIEIDVEIKQPVQNPLFRVQFYNNEPPHVADIFVYGTNTDRFGIKLGQLEPGRLRATLTIVKLNLLPRTYKLSIGVWPEETSDMPYDEKVLDKAFTVTGTPDDRGAVAHIPAEWVMHESIGEVKKNKLSGITLTGFDNDPKPIFATQEQVRVQLDVEIADPDRYTVCVLLSLSGLVVHAEQRAQSLSPGKRMVELLLHPVNLLEVDKRYDVLAFLVDLKTGEEVSTVARTLEIYSARGEGTGLVHLPSAWDIETD